MNSCKERRYPSVKNVDDSKWSRKNGSLPKFTEQSWIFWSNKNSLLKITKLREKNPRLINGKSTNCIFVCTNKAWIVLGLPDTVADFSRFLENMVKSITVWLNIAMSKLINKILVILKMCEKAKFVIKIWLTIRRDPKITVSDKYFLRHRLWNRMDRCN